VTSVQEGLSAAYGVLRRDWQLFLSYRMRLISQLLSMFFSITIFYYISRLVTVGKFASPDDYYAFAVVGLLILQVLNSTLFAPQSGLQGELFAGTFERLLLSPFGPVASICSTMLFPFVQALLTAVVMLGLASLAFGLPVEWSTAALAIPVAVLGTIAFACFGVALIGAVLIAKRATAATTWVIAAISIIAGVYFPVTLLPGWIQWASEVQPFTPTVDLMRNALVGTPLQDPALVDAAKIAGFAAVLMPLSIGLLAAAIRFSRRRATVLEY